MSHLQPSLIEHISVVLADKNLNPPYKFAVAYSGGLDSTVLLHAMVHWREIDPSIQVRAIHINHQLQEEANIWQEQCAEFCQSHDVDLISEKVKVIDSGKGLEAAARQARYSVFKNTLQVDEILLTAHHQNDQAETLMLRLLRGCGVEGASAMQIIKPLKSGWLMRPLLSYSRQQLEDYARKEGLAWVDDPTNASSVYDRNFLRNEIFPNIALRWPAYQQTLSRFTNSSGEHNALLQSYIIEDFEKCKSGDELDIAVLLSLEEIKQKYIIRHWIQNKSYDMPSESQLQEIFKLIHARDDAIPVVAWADYEIRRFQNKVYLMQKLPEFDSSLCMVWNSEDFVEIPGSGTISCINGQGAKLGGKLFIKFRQGGEKCAIKTRQGRHSLKKLFQENDVPPWLRDRMPIIYQDNDIVAVPNIFSNLENSSFTWLKE